MFCVGQDDSCILHHTSFSENDATMLAAFDASLPQGGEDAGKATAEVSSINDHTFGSNVVAVGVTSFKQDELTSKDILPEQCCISHSEAGLSYDRGTEIESAEHKMSDTSHCHIHVQKSNGSLDYVANRRHIANPGIESANASHTNAAVRPAANKAPPVISIQQKSAGRLSEKIKQTLQQNAKVDTPSRLNRLSAVIQKCDTYSADVADSAAFYGLPLKVKRLLETQRAITELYRKFCLLWFLFAIL